MASTIAPESIRTSPLFSGLAEKDINDLLPGGRLRSLAHGETLFYQGDVIAHFYLIVSGTVQLHRLTSDGHEKTLDIMMAGQPFCESEIMDGSDH